MQTNVFKSLKVRKAFNTNISCALSSSLKVITTCDNVVNERVIILEGKEFHGGISPSVVSLVFCIFYRS